MTIKHARLIPLLFAYGLMGACRSDSTPEPAQPSDNDPVNDSPDRDFVGEPAELPTPPRLTE